MDKKNNIKVFGLNDFTKDYEAIGATPETVTMPRDTYLFCYSKYGQTSILRLGSFTDIPCCFNVYAFMVLRRTTHKFLYTPQP